MADTQQSFSFQGSRPTLPITLRNGERTVECNTLLDTGASVCLFHGMYANLLEIDVSQANVLQFKGIAPGLTIAAYEAPIEIGLAGKFYKSVVYFSYDLPAEFQNILGHVGFFDRLAVEVNIFQQRIVLQEK